jgi:hypothetical protein
VKLVLLVKLAPLWEMVRLLLALRLTLLAQVILQALRLTLLALQKTEVQVLLVPLDLLVRM